MKIVSAPGRICLFGEHQDYLGLPVVAAAVNLRITVSGAPSAAPALRLFLPDTNENIEIPLRDPLHYHGPRDYIRSSVKVLRYEGFSWSSGWNIELRGGVPIGKGCSSSSAMCVAWIAFLASVADKPLWLAPERMARLAHRAEVVEFGEPGGIMDHFAAAVGGLIHIVTRGDFKAERLPDIPGAAFVLGDSLEPKATTEVLGRVKSAVMEGLGILKENIPAFDMDRVTNKDAATALDGAGDRARRAALGNIRNREITRRGLSLIQSGAPDLAAIGALLSEQHAILRDDLGISTPKVESLIDAAMEFAQGAKINGSGGGGCMFALCRPENADKVAEAIRRAGGEASVLKIDSGAREETA